MAFLTYFLCTVIVRLATGQIATINGRNPQLVNPSSNSRSSFTNTPLAKTMGTLPTLNNAKNIIPGNGLSSIANVQSNMGNQNFASNVASANALVASLDKAKPNSGNFINSQNPWSSSNVASRTISRNIPNSIASQYQLSGSNYNPAQNYNPTFASNLAKGNLASTNQAQQAGNWYPAGNAYSQSARHSGQQYGLHISADALQIAGNVAVTGNLPVHGTVSLSGKLPSGGVGTVNYSSKS